MYKNEQDKQLLESAMQNDVFYYNILHLAAKFEQRKKHFFVAGRPSFDWKLCEKIWHEKGESAKVVAAKHGVSVPKVYKIWQGNQPSHIAYKQEFGKHPTENAEHYVEWIKKEIV
jgi:hypothetical protein